MQQGNFFLGSYADATFAAEVHDVATLLAGGDTGKLNYDRAHYRDSVDKSAALEALTALDAPAVVALMEGFAEAESGRSSRRIGVRAFLPMQWQARIDVTCAPDVPAAVALLSAGQGAAAVGDASDAEADAPMHMHAEHAGESADSAPSGTAGSNTAPVVVATAAAAGGGAGGGSDGAVGSRGAGGDLRRVGGASAGSDMFAQPLPLHGQHAPNGGSPRGSPAGAQQRTAGVQHGTGADASMPFALGMSQHAGLGVALSGGEQERNTISSLGGLLGAQYGALPRPTRRTDSEGRLLGHLFGDGRLTNNSDFGELALGYAEAPYASHAIACVV